MTARPAPPPTPGDERASPLVRDHVTWPGEVILHPDHPVSEALGRMHATKTPFAPVVDGDAIVGVLSLRLLDAEPETDARTVADVMLSTVPFLYVDDPLVLGAAIAAHTEIGHFCVVDREHLLVGILSFDESDREGTDIDPLPLPSTIPPVPVEMARRRLVVTPGRAASSDPGGLDTYAEGPTLYVDGRSAGEPIDLADPASRRRRAIAMKTKL